MNDITCRICMDLIPLVRDGVASEDSCRAVLAHIRSCPQCAAAYEAPPPEVDDRRPELERMIRRTQTFSAMLMMFGMVFGLTLTAGSSVFYNVLIMPMIGALGYMLFRGRAFWLIPLLLTVTHFFTNLLPGREHLPAVTFAVWSGIYCAAALLGALITCLLCFAFRKEK